MAFLGRYKGLIAGSLQVVTFSTTNEASIFRVFIDTHFVATWARGHGLAKLLLEEAEKECKLNNYSHVLLDVRETQKRAIKLYEQIGYKLWGELPVYHKLENKKMVSGKYYYKDLGRNHDNLSCSRSFQGRNSEAREETLKKKTVYSII